MDQQDTPAEASELPPTDGGSAAWLYLISATVLETFVWGWPYSYGVFLDHYQKTWGTEGANRTLLPQVGTVSSGIMYLLMAPVSFYLRAYPERRTASMWIGVVMVVASLLFSAFATEAWHLIVTQGVLFGLGGIGLYSPLSAYLFEWWNRRRGFATGIMFSGTGLGGLTLPFIAQGLLAKFGAKATLIAFAIFYSIVLAATVPFIHPRIPIAKRVRSHREHPQASVAKSDWSFLSGRAFWLLMLGVTFQAFGGFIPGTYLPTFATAANLSTTIGTLSLALMNLTRIPGQIVIGHLADKGNPRRLMIGLAACSSISVYLIWGLSASPAAILVFSLLFGCFAGSYTALFPLFIGIVCAVNSLLSIGRGLGNILAGPISTRLLSLPGSPGSIGGYAIEGYGFVILFAGSMLALSGISAGYKGFKMT